MPQGVVVLLSVFDSLIRIRSLRLDISDKLAHRQELQYLAEFHSRALDGLPRSTNLVRSALEDYAVRITELDLSIAEAFERLACLQLDFWHKVTPCNFDVYTRRILTLRYCDAKSWYSVFQALQFSRSKVFRLHRQAVRALKKIPA